MAASAKAYRVRFVLLCVLITVFLSLAGCKTRFVYQQLDWLIPMYVNQQLVLNEGQEAQLQSQSDSLLAWHCRVQVPLYVQTLQSWQVFFAGNYSRHDFDRLGAASKDHFRLLSERILSDSKDLLFSLDAKQRARFYALIEKNNQEYEKKYLAAGVDLNELRLKEAREAARFWLGSISPRQDKILERRLLSYQNTEAESVVNRRMWLAQFRLILESGQALPQQKFQELQTLFFSPENHWSTDYKKRFDANADLMISIIEQVLAQSSDKQKKHLIQHFKTWESEFRDIARQCDKAN